MLPDTETFQQGVKSKLFNVNFTLSLQHNMTILHESKEHCKRFEISLRNNAK